MARRHRASVLAVLLMTVAASRAAAQLTLDNGVEARGGGNPFRPDLPSNRNDVYDRLDLAYALGSIRIGARFESYHHGFETPGEPGYDAVTQRWAEWSDPHLRARIGSFYTILGRGLIHRSFELPGVVLDQVIFPSRYTPSRELDGAIVEGRVGPLALRGFGGRPNSGEFSPAASVVAPEFSRHRGLVTGAQAVATLVRDASLGLAYSRISGESEGQREYGSVFAELDPLRIAGIEVVQFPLYAEVARKNADWGRRWGIGVHEADTAAVYASANLLAGPGAVSIEWKDYRGFRLGPNDPPSLVREHGFALLNRSTHFLDADQERGYQIEATLGAPAWTSWTLNLSRSDGALDRRFEERYGELRVAPPGDAWDATAFWARGRDTFLSASIGDRTIVGGAAGVRLGNHYGVTLDLERLDATRVDFRLRPIARFHELHATLGLTRAGWGAVSATVERTTDPDQEDPDDQASPGVQANTFFNATLDAQLGEHHQAQLFAGTRRGGPACTAGTCYVLEPFRGVELKLTSRF